MTLEILLHDRSDKVTSAGGNHTDLIAESNLVWPLKVSWNVFEVMALVKFQVIFGFSLNEFLFVSSDFFQN
jgi:polysaccharide pyruvyl transferase WcaK-like protein